MGNILKFFRLGSCIAEPAGHESGPLDDLDIACSGNDDSPIAREAQALLQRCGIARERDGTKGKASRLWFVLRTAGRPTGAACLIVERESARLIDIALLPETRGMRHGTALMGHVAEALRQRGVRTVQATARFSLKRFFARLGFRPDGELFYENNTLHLPVACDIAA